MTDVAANSSTTASIDEGVYRGHFATNNDEDWIAVELKAGVTYTIRALGSDSDNGTAQYVGIVDIYNSNSVAVSHNREEHFTIRQSTVGYFTTEAQTEFTPSASGTYYIAVDSWDIDIGSYTVYVTQDQIGGDGGETLTGGDSNDWIQGGRGDDVIEGGASADFLDGEWGDDRLTGGAGADTFTFYSDNWDDIRDNVANLWGNDTITDFDPSEDKIHFAGRIIRGLRDLTITEENGNTVLTADWGDSVTLLGVSADQLTEDNFKFRLGVRLEGGNIEGQEGHDSLVGTDANDTILGFEGDDTIRGENGENYLRGFEGDDLIIGGSSRDIIGGEEGNDTIRAGTGDDFVLSNEGNDRVDGEAGDDLIETHLGDDTLIGGGGDDTLRPGRGDDLMSGGSGKDYFVIGRLWGDDTITDFNLAEDILDFRGSGLDTADLTIAADGNNTVISNNGNSLTLVGVDAEEFSAVAADLILEPGSITSHYADFNAVDLIGDSSEDVLVTTGVVNDGGGRWTPDADGVARVSYSFLNYESVTVSEDGSTWWYDAIEPFTPLTQYTSEQEFALMETQANIELVWVEDHQESGGNLRLAYHQIVIGGASTTPYEGPYASDVFIGVHVGEEFHQGFVVHEFGHSLGFDDLPFWNELTGQDYTIMSYIRSARYEDAEHSSVFTESFMYADIAGLQYLYGVNEEATAGNETYRFDLSQPLLKTIFDADGTDTIAVQGEGDPVHINLTPGSWSNIGPDIRYEGGGALIALEPGTLFIMPNTVIENATGSSGDDTITGNDVANVLRGMDGDDTIRAGLGDDTIWAGAGDQGDDYMHGGDGRDVIAGGRGDDLIVGGEDKDLIYGGDGNDVIVLGEWNDANQNVSFQAAEAITSATTADVAYVGQGDDTVHGTDGNNVIGGGFDDDLVMGYAGDDIIFGGKGAGNDNLSGGDGDDTIFGAAGNDTVIGGAGNDYLWNGGGSDIVEGGTGSDTIWGGGGDDQLSGGAGADVFAFATTNGTDTITDFNADEDILNVQEASFSTFDAFLAAASETADGTMISFGETIIILTGISVSDLTQENVWI